jgi:hypothetical protein
MQRPPHRELHIFRDYIGRAIGSAEHAVGFGVVDYLLGFSIEVESASQAIGSVGEVRWSCGLVRFLDGGMNIFGAAAANAIDLVTQKLFQFSRGALKGVRINFRIIMGATLHEIMIRFRVGDQLKWFAAGSRGVR